MADQYTMGAVAVSFFFLFFGKSSGHRFLARAWANSIDIVRLTTPSISILRNGRTGSSMAISHRSKCFGVSCQGGFIGYVDKVSVSHRTEAAAADITEAGS